MKKLADYVQEKKQKQIDDLTKRKPNESDFSYQKRMKALEKNSNILIDLKMATRGLLFMR